MEPDRFNYSPIVDRPKLSWPNGERLAVWVLPNVEHYEYLPKFQMFGTLGPVLLTLTCSVMVLEIMGIE